MAENADQELIRAYARTRCETAFAELVHRHIDFVYSTAVRVVRDAGLAEDVTQGVFLALAQHAGKLQDRASLIGWLHETARNSAVSAVRGEERRRQREKEAASMKLSEASDTESLWKAIATHLDEALSQLSGTERDVILWRYFERRTAEQIGERLGLTGEAAQKRVTRALERLRGLLAERGPVAPMTGLAAMLSAQVQSAPIGLAASAIATASAANVAPPIVSTLQIVMASTKAKIGLFALMAASVSAPLVLEHQRTLQLRNELAMLRLQGPELDRLLEEVQRLASNQQESAEQREWDQAELARLRGELGALKARRAVAVSRSQQAPAEQSVQQSEAAAESKAPFIRAEEWGNVGFGKPSSSLQTIEWAKANRATNVIAKALAWADEPSRTAIETLFAAAPESVRSKYGTADGYILSLFDWPEPPQREDRRRVAGYRILGEKVAGDEATLQIEFHYGDGSTSTAPMRYVRIGGDWRQALAFDEPDQGKMSAGLNAEAQRSDE